VEGDGCRSGVDGGPGGVEVREVLGVDAHPQLDRHRDGTGSFDGRGDDVSEQPTLERERGTAAMAGHLGNRAPEVQVDVVDPPLPGEQLGCGAQRPGLDAVELDRAGVLVVGEAGELVGLVVPFDEGPRPDHLADIEAATESPAEGPERGVRDPRHRRQDHRGAHVQRTDTKAHDGSSSKPAARHAARVATKGRPMTVCGSPSTDSTKTPPIPCSP
jgi:hypothetical protein